MYHTGNSHPRCILLISLLGILLCGCSPGIPSESQARALLENRIAQHSDGNIKLASFRKLNGVPDNNTYRLEYEAEIEFASNGSWEAGNERTRSYTGFKFHKANISGGANDQFMAELTGTQNVRAGEKKTVKGSFTFQKTENGWRSIE